MTYAGQTPAHGHQVPRKRGVVREGKTLRAGKGWPGFLHRFTMTIEQQRIKAEMARQNRLIAEQKERERRAQMRRDALARNTGIRAQGTQ